MSLNAMAGSNERRPGNTLATARSGLAGAGMTPEAVAPLGAGWFARRLAGAQSPAPSAASSPPDPRPGRRRARFALLLPALALLLGALSLLGAAPAQAQTIWVAEFTPASLSGGVGCTPASHCASRLSDKDFTVGGADYVVEYLFDFSGGTFAVTFNLAINTALSALKFCVGPTAFAFSSASLTNSDHRANWSGANLAWSAGQKVPLSIGTACAPGGPTSLGATPSAGQLALSWTAPTATGGSAITGYDVHYTGSATVDDGAPAFPSGSDPADGWVNAGHDGTTASDSLTGLAPVTTYRVRVRAVNAAGSSPWVRVSGTTPAVPPGEVTGLSAAPGHTRLDLSWAAPAATGGSALTGYDVHYTSSTTVDDDAAPDPGGSASGWFDTNHGTATTRAITGLTNDRAYRVRVRAVNAAGDGPWVHVTARPRVGNPTVSGVTLTANGSPVTVTRYPGSNYLRQATVPYDATSVTVTPTWAGPATGTVRSVEYGKQSNVYTGPTSVVSGGSVTVDLNPSEHWYRDFTLVVVDLSLAPGYAGARAILIKKGGPITASISVAPETVREGGPGQAGTRATVAVTLSQPADRDIVFPLTTGAGTSEAGDWYIQKRSVLIRRGTMAGTTYVRALEDEDTDDETFAVALGPVPSGLTPLLTVAGVTIDDNDDAGDAAQDDLPTVTLSATPNPVPEGEAVTVTATLSKAASGEATIPVLATRDTAEHDDIGTHRLDLVIPAGATSATGTLATTVDTDGDDERFSVDVVTADLPLNVALSASGVTLTIEDTTTTPPETAPTLPVVTVTAGSDVTEGADAEFTLTAAPAPASDLRVVVEVTESGAFAQRRALGTDTVTIPAGATSANFTVATVDDTTDEADGSVTATLVSSIGSYTVGAAASATVTVADNDAAVTPVWSATLIPKQLLAGGSPHGVGCDTQTTGSECSTSSILSDDDFSLGGQAYTIEQIWDELRDVFTVIISSQSAPGDDLKALNFCVGARTFALSGMSHFFGDEYRSRWLNTDVGWSLDNQVMVSIASACPTTGTGSGVDGSGLGQTDRPPVAVHRYAALIAKMYEWRNDPQWVHAKAHTDRWDRALKAFGETVADASLTAMTAAEAQGFANRGWTRWVEVAEALREIESARPRPPAPPTPVVTVAAGSPVNEGADAGFTLTAAPAPASDLGVTVTVGESGAFAQGSALGPRTVTIPAGHTSAAFQVATVDDAADEPDGAVVAALGSGSGYTLGNAARATVAVADNDQPAAAVVPGIVTKRSMAREGRDEAAVFTVRLDRAASGPVTVDYATADGAGRWAGTAPARAGADYTATSGTLAFAPGETLKTVSVPLLDDAIDEGTEYFLLRFSNPQGAKIEARYRETQGLIRNSDPLQAMWLARFGRMVASDAVASVTARLETPRDAGSHVTFAGQRMNFGEDEGGGGAALATVLTGLAQTFGAPSAPAVDDDPGSGAGAGPFARHRLTSGWNDPATVTGARRVTGRELLLGTSFRAVLGQGAGSQWTSWGQGASVSQFSAAVPGLGLTGEAATGSMGMDYESGRLLMGFAMTHSVGEGTASDARWRYALGSTATMAMPYARLALSDRVSVWGLTGTGSGRLSLDLDGAVPQSYRTDLAMTLAATGVRGELVTPAEPGGFALALKADAFWVRTESDRVTASAFGSLMGARGESSRVRAVLDGSRTFAFASGAALTPSLELGVRHDAGDAETGTGLEVGAGLGFADPSRGLDMALRVHGLAVHAQDGYDEWGVSGQLRLVPGGAGRGLSMSLTPSYGVDPSGSERLWALPASSGLAANGEAEPSSRFDAEAGYGMSLLGDRFTGTPNVGFGLSDTARDYRIGWRLTSAVRGDPGFEVSLDAVRREAANDNQAEHGVMLRSMIRW